MNFDKKSILITGGTGSWGHELTRQLLRNHNPSLVRVYSRNENAQVMMKRSIPDASLEFVIGDVRDKDSLIKATKGIDIVFHLAALKHVPIGESNPDEFIKTNIQGTTNLRDACISSEVEKAILVSTDKACAPINLYGYSKSIAEKIFITANSSSVGTEFQCIRGGNALGSNGSVVPLFIEQIKKYNQINITDERMTRFFLTLPEAVGLLFKAASGECGVGTYVMKMPSFKITDIAKCLIQAHGNKDTKINIVGIRPGEKIHETLVSESECADAYEYGNQYLYVKPQIEISRNRSINYNTIRKTTMLKFDSSEVQDIEKAKELLVRGCYI
jgi:nucleoside-diphosphate-sugar epimerase